MTVKIKMNLAELNAKLDEQKTTYLRALGQATVNQMVDVCPVKTGLLRNSITFRTLTDKSEFGSEGNARPVEDDRVSQPNNDDSVRVGSSVVYARRVNFYRGYVEKTKDAIKGQLTLIAKRVFKI